MARLAELKIECPGCHLKTAQVIPMPKWDRAEFIAFTCSGCESGVWAKLSIPKQIPFHSGQIRIQSKITRESELLRAMMKEEAEFNQPEPS